MSPDRCYQACPPNVDLSRLTGRLVVLEGPDSSGRSTHIQMLTRWIEERGYAVVGMGIKRSMLVAQELDRAKSGNILSPRTMSLFYATDFYDQMENIIIPALRSGAVVLADRYIYTLMARDLVRGAELGWLESLYSRALVPDRVFFLKVPPRELAIRALKSNEELDYWESGMDIGFSHDWYECFLHYQGLINETFWRMGSHYDFTMIDGTLPKERVQRKLRDQIENILPAH